MTRSQRWISALICAALVSVSFSAAFAGGTGFDWNNSDDYERSNVVVATTEKQELTSLDYLAFSELAYLDWQVSTETIQQVLQKPSKNKWNSYIDEKAAQNPIITFGDICRNIGHWWVAETSKHWGKVETAGFYAVTFTNGKQTVIAYRGSANMLKLFDCDTDAINDWLLNDIPFHVFHFETEQMTYALAYYEHCNEELKLNDIRLTGHSLGGGLASYVSILTDEYAEIFNAASTYETLFMAEPEKLVGIFHGTDTFRVVSHVNEKDEFVGRWNEEYRVFENYVYKSSYSTSWKPITGQVARFTFKHHAMVNMLKKDKDGQVVFNDSKHTEKGSAASPGDLHLYLGTSKFDSKELRTYIDLESYIQTNNIQLRVPLTLYKNFNKVLLILSKGAYLYGGDGNDSLSRPTLGSNDVIVGGRGDDVLDGGPGNDTYYYMLGDGTDRIEDTSGKNTVVLQGFGDGSGLKLTRADYSYGNYVYGTLSYRGEPIIYLRAGDADRFSVYAGKKLIKVTGSY